ncbi:hypothetical protein VVD49_05780 [Uliginosibacterium sp. H3]|uniref:Uncharacterized protein n=1 Tax=Uliginosibacterium silvisoli TaxID=3114758 RepID=A0ABU6K0C1_9RHOO|nr:hypothetical protein [Uliginosibacterium sp. H3]
MSAQQADSAFERFIAGEDRLAALLRTLPVYEAPPAMAARLAGLARVAQEAYPAVPQVAPAALPMFEPPASLEVSFLAEAARIQAAQQPRHDAVIEQIQSGRTAAEVLGHDVTAGTAAWLESRPQRIADKATDSRKAAQQETHRWWQRIGLVMASVAVGVIATNLWLAQRAERPETINAAMNDAAKRAAPLAEASAAKASQPTTIALQVDPIARVSGLGRAPAVSAAGDARESVVQRVREQTAEARRVAGEAELADSAATEAGASDRARQDAVQERMREQEQKLERRADTQAFAKAAAIAEERPAAAPPAAPAPAAAIAPQERMASTPQPARQAPRLAAAPAPAPAPAPAMEPAAAAPAPVASAAKPADDRSSSPLLLSRSVSPPLAAARWRAKGLARAPRIFSATPQSEAVRDWAERFRLALPSEERPAQLTVERNDNLRADSLLLE